MNYYIYGPIPKDTITTVENITFERYGCILNTAIPLALLADEQDFIYPVSHIKKNDEKNIKALLKQYTHIKMDYLSSKDNSGSVIELHYHTLNDREEKPTEFMSPITKKDIKNAEEMNINIFAQVTDFEVARDTLQAIKKKDKKNLIIFDAHGETITVTKNLERIIKSWIDLDLWLPYIDILKMNHEELRCCLSGFHYHAETHIESHIDELTEKFAKHCFKKGVKTLVITENKEGCFYYEKDNFNKTRVPGIKVQHVVDTTGCGDAFLAGLAYGVSKNNNILLGCQLGNVIAALRTQGTEYDVFQNKAQILSLMEKSYGNR